LAVLGPLLFLLVPVLAHVRDGIRDWRQERRSSALALDETLEFIPYVAAINAQGEPEPVEQPVELLVEQPPIEQPLAPTQEEIEVLISLKAKPLSRAEIRRQTGRTVDERTQQSLEEHGFVERIMAGREELLQLAPAGREALQRWRNHRPHK
jgi:hypothetical protein